MSYASPCLSYPQAASYAVSLSNLGRGSRLKITSGESLGCIESQTGENETNRKRRAGTPRLAISRRLWQRNLPALVLGQEMIKSKRPSIDDPNSTALESFI